MRINKSGFTLIEILIVLVIIGFMAGVAIPRFGRSTGSKVKSFSRQIVLLNRELYNAARVRNRTYRLVWDFGNKDLKKGPKVYVESGEGKQLLSEPDATPTPSRFSKNDKPVETPFTTDTDIVKRPMELPDNIVIKEVQLDSKRSVTGGVAYVYFFPQGVVSSAIVHLTDGKNIKQSIVIHGVTGETDVMGDFIQFRDIEP